MPAVKKPVDPRSITATPQRVAYIYGNPKAFAAYSTYAEANKLPVDPEEADPVQLNRFWSAEILGVDADQTPDGDRGPTDEAPGEGRDDFKLPAIDDDKSKGRDDGRGNDQNPDTGTGGKSEQDLLAALLQIDPEKGGEGQGQDEGGQNSQSPPPEEEEAVHRPRWWKRFLFYCNLRDRKGNHKPVLLVGPSGSGKTHVSEDLAKYLKLKFRAVCCTEGMSEESLVGYPRPNLSNGTETFLPGPLVKVCEEGGVLLLDEADAMNPNVMLALNSLLANGWLAVPGYNNDEPIKVHKDALFVFSMNTFGSGADRQYVGRNAQDAAFLNRLACQSINIDYDEDLEKEIGHPDAVAFGHRVRKRCRFNDDGKPRVGWYRDISTRTILDWSDQINAGCALRAACYGFFEDWSDEELKKVKLKRIKDACIIKEV